MDCFCIAPDRKRLIKTLRIFKIMRLTAFFIMVASLHISAKSLSQTVSLSLKDVPLQQVLTSIGEQTKFHFLYSDLMMRESHSVTLSVSRGKLADVLSEVFSGQPLVYRIEVEKQLVIVSERPKVPGKEAATADDAGTHDVKGIIVDEHGTPIEGVSITVKGTSKGTMTDAAGQFVLKSVNDADVLLISHIGYETEEVKAKNRGDLSMRLKLNINSLSNVEVQVSNGYQFIPKERATGSFDYVDNSLLNRSVSTDVISRLNGIASGLLFDKTAANPLNLQIRGMSTIQANTQPLIILDNFPYDGDIQNINPNDIESITILKDAGAQSIWGVRAGNGVVVITSKKGRLNQPLQINVNANVTVSAKPNLYYNPNFLDASDFIDVEQQLFTNGYYDPWFASRYQAPISPVVDLLNQAKSGTISPGDANSQINAFRNIDVRNDEKKYFYRSAVAQQYSLNLSGGSNKTAYFFSGGLDRNTQSQVGNGYQRVTLAAKNIWVPIRNLEVSADLNFAQTTTNVDNTLSQLSVGGVEGLAAIYPYAQLADASGRPLPVLHQFSNDFVRSAPGLGYLPWTFMPLQELRDGANTSTTHENDIRATAGIKYSFLNGFSLDGKYEYEKLLTDGLGDQTQGSFFTRSMINQYASVDPSSGMVTGFDNLPPGDILSYNYGNLEQQDLRLQLNYNKSWAVNNIAFIGGYEARFVQNNGNGYNVYGYDPSSGTFQDVNTLTTFPVNPFGAGIIPSGQSITGTLNRFRSYFSNASYTLENKYTVSASGRIDQSNLFGVDYSKKTVPLWSAGVKWAVDRESFYHSTLIPQLDLRLTYGYSGNIDNNIYAYPTAIYFSQPGNYGSLSIANLTTTGDPNLRWETSRMINAGVDFSLAKSVLTGSVEYYSRAGKNLIGTEPVPASSGVSSVIGNYSDMKGQGYDIKLNANIINRKFKWQSELLVSYTANKITQYLGSPQNLNYRVVVGKPVSGLYGLRWAGLDPQNGDPRGYLNDTISKQFALINSQPISGTGNKFLPTSSWVYKGPSQPTYFGGFRNTFTYKDISLSFNLVFKAGYVFQRSSIDYYLLFATWQGNRDFVDRWQKPGDETKTNVPSMPALTGINQARDVFYNNSEVLLVRGDHIRFQDINLSYSIYKNKRALPFSMLQVYSYINNVGILWRANKNNLDPDSPVGIPTPRSVALGVKATF
jgi:TonB-linked SusC/RagA family outer membrane protein